MTISCFRTLKKVDFYKWFTKDYAKAKNFYYSWDSLFETMLFEVNKVTKVEL